MQNASRKYRMIIPLAFDRRFPQLILFLAERQENIAPSSVPKDALSECQGEDDGIIYCIECLEIMWYRFVICIYTGLPDLWLDPGDITSDNAFTVVISKSEIQCAVQEKCLSNLHPRITRFVITLFVKWESLPVMLTCKSQEAATSISHENT